MKNTAESMQVNRKRRSVPGRGNSVCGEVQKRGTETDRQTQGATEMVIIDAILQKPKPNAN